MQSEDNRDPIIKEGETRVADQPPNSGSLAFDSEEYLPHMLEFDLTEEQARELLATLYEIMKSFVDLGFGVDSIHAILPAWKEASEEFDALALESEHEPIAETFKQAANDRGAKEEES